MEAYTECYVSVKDAKALTAFTSQYDVKVEKVQENIEEIADEQGKRRVDEIREEAEAELADAQAELDKGKKEAEEKLTDAKKQIDDGEKQLQEGKEQLKKANDELQSGKNKLYASQKEVDAAKKEISDGWSQYNTAKKEFDAQEAAFKEQYDTGMAEIAREKKSLRKLGMTLIVRKRNMTVALQLLHRRRSYLRSFWQAWKAECCHRSKSLRYRHRQMR